jgi:hypothetical protein
MSDVERCAVIVDTDRHITRPHSRGIEHLVACGTARLSP